MCTEIDKAIETLAKEIKSSIKALDAMQMAQAILSLAHARIILDDCE